MKPGSWRNQFLAKGATNMNTGLFRIMLALAATFVTLAGARPVNAKTYYVDWYTGNDNNTGASPALAWKSINAGDARGLINAGDVIQVAQGIYRPIGPPYTGWDFNRGGTSTNHVVYRANGPVRVDGNYAIWYLFNL